jgi:hypothetical protein
MDRDTSQLPKALVLRWNSETLRVRCPYCLYSHLHGYAGPLANEIVDQTRSGWKLRLRGNWRQSDCAEGGVYTFVFPCTGDIVVQGYGWEVNDENFEFVAVNKQGTVEVPINDWQDGRTLLPQYQNQAQDSTDFDDAEVEIDSLADITNGLNLEDNTDEEDPLPSPPPRKTDDEILEELFSDPSYRKICYISHCVRCEIPELEQLCRQYSHDELIGCVDETGDSGALLAAIEEKGLETLRWLHNRGDSITRANHYGRTPLMEAVLWGRLETVQYLAQQKVDLEARDGNGMRAVDLAANTVRNTKERAERLRHGSYREASNADRRRRQIEELLERLTLYAIFKHIDTIEIAGKCFLQQKERWHARSISTSNTFPAATRRARRATDSESLRHSRPWAELPFYQRNERLFPSRLAERVGQQRLDGQSIASTDITRLVEEHVSGQPCRTSAACVPPRSTFTPYPYGFWATSRTAERRTNIFSPIRHHGQQV